jgi:hypothetical protein
MEPVVSPSPYPDKAVKYLDHLQNAYTNLCDFADEYSYEAAQAVFAKDLPKLQALVSTLPEDEQAGATSAMDQIGYDLTAVWNTILDDGADSTQAEAAESWYQGDFSQFSRDFKAISTDHRG